MNIQKLIDQTRNIYDNHEHTTTVMDALDYLEQIAKKEEELRVSVCKKGKVMSDLKSPFDREWIDFARMQIELETKDTQYGKARTTMASILKDCLDWIEEVAPPDEQEG